MERGAQRPPTRGASPGRSSPAQMSWQQPSTSVQCSNEPSTSSELPRAGRRLAVPCRGCRPRPAGCAEPAPGPGGNDQARGSTAPQSFHIAKSCRNPEHRSHRQRCSDWDRSHRRIAPFLHCPASAKRTEVGVQAMTARLPHLVPIGLLFASLLGCGPESAFSNPRPDVTALNQPILDGTFDQGDPATVLLRRRRRLVHRRARLSASDSDLWALRRPEGAAQELRLLRVVLPRWRDEHRRGAELPAPQLRQRRLPQRRHRDRRSQDPGERDAPSHPADPAGRRHRGRPVARRGIRCHEPGHAGVQQDGDHRSDHRPRSVLPPCRALHLRW